MFTVAPQILDSVNRTGLSDLLKLACLKVTKHTGASVAQMVSMQESLWYLIPQKFDFPKIVRCLII